MKLLTHALLIFQLLFAQTIFAQAGFPSFGDALDSPKKELVNKFVKKEECSEHVYSSNPSVTKVKCIKLNPIIRSDDPDNKAKIQSQKIFDTIKAKKDAEFLGNLVSREIESFTNNSVCSNESGGPAPFEKLARDINGVTNCNVSNLIEERCDCIMQALQSGRMKKLSREQRKKLNRIIIGSAGKKSFMENLSNHVSQSAVLAYFLNNGTVEQRKKILENKNAHVCLPGKMKEALQNDKCGPRIKAEISESFLRREEYCSQSNSRGDSCKDWSEFKDVLGITHIDKRNPLMSVIQSYEASSKDNYFSSGYFSSHAKIDRPQEMISSIKMSLDNKNVGRVFQFPRSKEELNKFIEKLTTYEKAKAEGVNTRDVIEGQSEYIDAMNMINHVYQSPFITSRYSEFFSGVNTDVSVSEYFFQIESMLNNKIGYDFDQMISNVENESLDYALTACSNVSKKFSNTCSMQSPLKRIRPEDFVMRGNEILTALQDAVSDVTENAREDFESGAMQYYCSIYAASLEKGQVDLVEDDFNIVTDYSYRQKTIDHFKDSLKRMGKVASDKDSSLELANKEEAPKEFFKDSNVISEAMINYDSGMKSSVVPSSSFVVPKNVVEAKKTIASLENMIDSGLDSDLKDTLKEDLEKFKSEFTRANLDNDRKHSNDNSSPMFREMMEKLEMMNKKVEELSAENERKKKRISELTNRADSKNIYSQRAAAQKKSIQKNITGTTNDGSYRQSASTSRTSGGGGISAPSSSGSSPSAKASSKPTNEKPSLSLTLKEARENAGTIIVSKRSEVFAALLNANGAPVMLEVSKGVFEKYEPVIGEDGKVIIKDGKPLFKKVIVKIDKKKEIKKTVKSNLGENSQKNESKRKIYRLDDLNREIDKSKEN